MQLISTTQVMEMLGVSRSTLWRLVQAGQFPPPVRLSRGRTAYVRQAVEEWISARAHAEEAQPPKHERPSVARQNTVRRSWGTGGPLRPAPHGR